MTQNLSLPDPGRFGLASFAELLPSRDPIIGESPGAFAGFRESMMIALAPFTPYECVVAENLIAIEWEILQHRQMRDAALRKKMRDVIQKAVIERNKHRYALALDEAWDVHVEAGGTEEDWEDPFEFDTDAADREGEDLAERAVSTDPGRCSEAHEEIAAMGLQPIELMSQAYSQYSSPIHKHDEKLQELERRRREVKRDYDVLQKSRPVENVLPDADESDTEILEG